MSPVLQLTGVSRTHAGRTVWAPVDLQVDAGTLCVITGRNGSGKTTLLRLAAGLLRPSTGVRQCTGPALYVRGGGGLRGAQSVADAVTSAASLTGRRPDTAAALERLGLAALAGRRVGTLSAGEKVRAALAAAWAAEPALLCLDEPTAVLDQRGLQDLADFLTAVRARGGAVVVASHQPEALLAIADGHLELVGHQVISRRTERATPGDVPASSR